MNVVVKEADLLRDQQAIIDLHRDYLTSQADSKRFDWLYRHNPFGAPMVWMAYESHTGAPVGTAAAFPRSLYMESKKEMGWILGDFCISDAYRTLGPALQLQRTCLEGVGMGTNTLWYDFPSRKMLAIYKRLKIVPTGDMIRFVKLLRVDQKIRTWVTPQGLHHSLAGLGNRLLKWTTKRIKPREGLTFQEHYGECGQEFTELSEQIGNQIGNCLDRTASYLNWRYGYNPLYSCEFVVARLHGKLQGYAVFAEIDGSASILDVFSRDEHDVILGLISQVVDRVRERGYDVLSIPIVEGHTWIPYLQSYGFHPRGTDPVIIQNPALMVGQANGAGARASLLLMQGDRDT